MGNEGSSLQPHVGVSKIELETLQKSFPSHHEKIKKLWKPWTEIFDDQSLENIERYLKLKTGDFITFQSYQQLYGDCIKSGLTGKILFLIILVDGSGTAQRVTLEKLEQSLQTIIKAFIKSHRHSVFKSKSDDDALTLSRSILHDLVHGGEKRKNTFLKEFAEESVDIEKEDIENVFMKNPLIEMIYDSVLEKCFQMKSVNNSTLIPNIAVDTVTSLSVCEAVFLNTHLPHQLRQVWRPLFNTSTHGESFSKFAGSITKQGPTLIIVCDENNRKFGGFATDSWRTSPKFYGKSESFLFHLHPEMNIYDSTPFNQNYQYFNLKQKTMPNGLGMGGQLEYFGFWIDNEFGVVKTSPSCSTYHSPQLSQLEGKIKSLEVFGVGELSDDDLDAGPSVLDLDPEAQAVLEMMGKTFHSKVIREVDEDQEKKKSLEAKNIDS